MKDFYKRDFLEFASPKVLLFGTQLMLSATALGLFLWSLTTYIKYRIVSQISLELYDWTYIFFRPVKSALINYLVACLIFGVGGLILYLCKNRLRLERWQDVGTKIPLPLLLFSLLVSIGLLASLTWTGSRAWIMFKAFFVFCVPFPLFLWNRLNLEGKIADLFYIFLSLMLLLLVSLEPIRVVREPVLFMNDFPDIFGETYLKGGKVSNKTFLENLSKVDVDALRSMWQLYPSKRERVIVWPKAYELYTSKAMPVFEAILKVWDRIQPCRIEMIWMVQSDVKIWYEKLFPEHIKASCPTYGRLTREETLARIANARVMIAPSLSDGIPNTMMEAMALGAAPLVSPLDTIVPVVKNEENVIFARNLYPDEIAEALVRLMSDDSLVDRMADNNLVRIREMADRKQVRERALVFYEEVARLSRRSDNTLQRFK